MADRRTGEALERLNQGVEESRRMFQRQTMKLSQEYFDDSIEELKQQARDNRATLESLTAQIPGREEESFRMILGELEASYAKIERCIAEAQENVANLDTEKLIKQGEVEASDAARRTAQELGVDLTQVRGTGSGGRVVVDDVRSLAEDEVAFGESPKQATWGVVEEAAGRAEQAVGAAGEPEATDAARREAKKLGVDLSQVRSTGSEGSIILEDVSEFSERTRESAAQEARDTAEAARRSDAGGNAQRAEEALDRMAGEIGQDAQGAQDASGGRRITNAARRKAEERGVDLSEIEGSGAGGLITIKDVVGG